MTDDRNSRIVVGVDGSATASKAFAWAVHQAVLTGQPLHVVTAWTYPTDPTPFGIVPDLPPPADELAEVRAMLDAFVARHPTSGLSPTTEVVAGRAGPVLVAAARDAALLVVGSRGRSAVAEVLLGSVSEFCVRHATCPVVVVRHAGPPADG